MTAFINAFSWILIVGVVMPNLHFYFLAVGLKVRPGLNRLVRVEDHLEVDIAEITVVVGEDCCCMVELIDRSSIYLGNETRCGLF